MGDVERGDFETLDQLAQLETSFLPELCVQVAQRFVEQQYAGLFDQRAGEGEPLLLAAAEKGSGAASEAIELNQRERSGNFLVNLWLRQARLHLSQGKGDVFKDIQMRPNGIGLKDHADVSFVRRYDNLRRRREDQVIADKDFSLVWCLQTGHRSQGGSFAAAARAEQRMELTLLDFQVDTADRVHTPLVGLVVDVKIANLDHTVGDCTNWRRKPI